LHQHIDLIVGAIDQLLESFQSTDYNELPRLVIHGDYHPENLMFLNEEVSGVFDFGGAKVDVRIFDIAYAIVYFCVGWKGEDDGKPDLEKVALFLKSYQRYFAGDNKSGLLSQLERKYLITMIEAANLYLLYWIVDDYLPEKPKPEENLVYLQHCTYLLKSMQDSRTRELLSSICG
jgi:homoserine kinase type II